MCLGLPGATAISSLFRANVTGVSTRPAVTSLFMLVWSADAKTSAGAPCWIWVTSALDPAKLDLRSSSGLARMRPVFAELNAPVSDAAANTSRPPVTVAPAEVALGAVVEVTFEAIPWREPLEPQATTITENAARAVARAVLRFEVSRAIALLPGSGGRNLHHDVGGLHRGHRHDARSQGQLVGGLAAH